MVVGATQAHFVVQQPRGTVNKMRMAVHKAGHHHATGSVDLRNVTLTGNQPLDFFGSPGGGNRTIADKQRSIGNDTQVAESRAAPGSVRATQCQQLTRATDQQSFTHASGASLAGARSPACLANRMAAS